MLKLKSYSFTSECIASFSGFWCICRNDDNGRRFYFRNVPPYTRIHTHVNQICRVYAIAAEDSSVRRWHGRDSDRVKCFPAAVERPRACKSDAAARLPDMQHGTEHARVRSRVPSIRPSRCRPASFVEQPGREFIIRDPRANRSRATHTRTYIMRRASAIGLSHICTDRVHRD